MDCGLVAAGRLGVLAKPLEPYLCEALCGGHVYAAHALGLLGTLDEASIVQLANKLDGDPNLSFECAAALIACGQTGHQAVLDAVARSERAAKVMAHVAKHFASRRV